MKIRQLVNTIENLEEQLIQTSSIYCYINLQRLLKEGDWMAADCETLRLILESAGATGLADLHPNKIESINCSELRNIDTLWLAYSDNRFGFSIQTTIYRELAGSEQTAIAKDAESIAKWAERLGWRNSNYGSEYSDSDYSQPIEQGRFPSLCWNFTDDSNTIGCFLARLMSCGILAKNN